MRIVAVVGLAILLAVLSDAIVGDIGNCFSSRLVPKCVEDSGLPTSCVIVPSETSSIALDMSGDQCRADENIASVCNRSKWVAFGNCIRSMSSANSTCSPFVEEADCWTLALEPLCGGALSGVCHTVFNFPKKNCTQLPSVVSAQAMCPVANALMFCTNCLANGTGLSLLDYSIFLAAKRGLITANAHNTILFYPRVPSLFNASDGSTTALFEDLEQFIRLNDVHFVICGNELPFFDTMVAHLSSRAGTKFAAYLRLPLSRPLSSYANVLFMSARLDLVTTVAAAALAAQSSTGVLLFSSQIITTTFDRLFFMGFARGAQAQRPDATVLWGVTLDESMAAAAEFHVDGAVSGAIPQLLYPLLASGTIAGVGVFLDYLADPVTFRSQNNTFSQSLLFSVVGNFNAVIAPQFRAAGLGDFRDGLEIGDATSIGVVPCEHSCSRITPAALTAMKRSFATIHRFVDSENIDYTTGEYVYPRTESAASAVFHPTGESHTFVSTPKIVAVSAQKIVLVNLESAVASSRVWLCTFLARHCQRTLTPTSAAPTRRSMYAVSSDSSGVYISMGVVGSSNVDSSEIWMLRVSRSMQLAQTWQLLCNDSVSLEPRHGHATVVFGNVLYLFGGSTTNTSMQRFSLDTATWLPAYSPPTSGDTWMGHSMVIWSLPNGSTARLAQEFAACRDWIIVAGGRRSVTNTADSLMFHCPTLDVWVDVLLSSNVAGATRVNFCAVALPSQFGHALLLVGGSAATAAIHIDAGTYTTTNDKRALVVDVIPTSALSSMDADISCASTATSAMLQTSDWTVLLVTKGPLHGGALRYYYPNPVSCTGGTRSVQSKSRLSCDTCPPQHFSDVGGGVCVRCRSMSDNPMCPYQLNTALVVVAVVVIGAFMIVVVPLSVQGLRSFRNLRRMAKSQRIAVELAESVSTLQFDRLAFVAALKHPTRLERSFLSILEMLVTYMQFMPMWVFAADRIRSDSVSSAADSDDVSSGEEDDAMPNAMPRRATKRAHLMEGPASRYAVSPTAGTRLHDASSAAADGERPRIHAALDKYHQKMFQASVTVVLVHFINLEQNFLTISKANHRGRVVKRVDSALLSGYFAAITDRIDKLGGLVEHQMGARMIVTFNGLRLHREPEVAALRLALSLEKLSEQWVPEPSTPEWSAPIIPKRRRFVACGIATGQAYVAVVGKRFGKSSTVVGSLLPEAARWCDLCVSIGPREAVSALLPYVAVKNLVGSKLVLKVLGEGRSDAAGIDAGASPQRVLLAGVVGARKDVSPAELVSVDARNTLLEYIFSGAPSAADQHLKTVTDRRVLLDADRHVVESALVDELVPQLAADYPYCL